MGKIATILACIVVAVALGLVSTSCASGRPTPTSTPTDASRSVPTARPTPTSTPTDAARSVPTVRPTPTSTRVAPSVGVPTPAADLEDLYIKALAKYFGTMNKKDAKEKELTLYEAILGLDELVQTQDFNAKGEAYLFKGLALNDLRRYQQALQAFDQAAYLVDADGSHAVMKSASSRYESIWSGRGEALMQLGRYSEAARAVEKAIEIDPESATAWSLKGGVHLHMGEYGEAKRAFEKALRLDPDSIRARAGLVIAEAALKR